MTRIIYTCSMTLQVSVYCGDDSEMCNHKEPIFFNIGRGPAVILSETFAQEKRWPSFKLSNSAENMLDHESGALSKMLIDNVQCTSCIILTSLPNTCSNSRCKEKMHVLDMMSYETMSRMQDLLAESHMLCLHASYPLARLAAEQSTVLISNCLDTDPRIEKKLDIPPAHFKLHNIMCVPLMVTAGANVHKVGVALLCNKKVDSISEHCQGFNMNDYTDNYTIFADLSAHILTSYHENCMQQLRNTIELQQQRHAKEMAKSVYSQNIFIATMSHEIRTPLNAVNGYNEILMSNITAHTPDVFTRCLRKQRDAVLQLAQLIGNILDFSKLKSNGLKLDSKPFNLDACINRAVEINRPDCDAKRLSMVVKTDPSVPTKLIGDPTRLYQILANIVSNAVKYTTSGFINIESKMVKRDDGYVVIQISVRDTGRGIPESAQEAIFDDFQQIRDCTSPTAASVQGVGLGLSICRELVKLMRGRIWVESDGRSGSTFHFTVCLRDDKTIERMIGEAREKLGQAAVLIVDDQEVNRVLMTRMIIEWGMRPHACSSLDEAVHMLSAFPSDYFRIALVDMDISGESGLMLARRIEHDKAFLNLIVIAVSSVGGSFTGSEEFDAVHEKPIRSDDLLADIIRLLGTGPRRKHSLARSVVEYSHASKVMAVSKNRGVEGHIMIVDDDEPSLLVTGEMLENLGYDKSRIHLVSSAREALSELQRTSNILCIFMDLVMPEMDGIECTRIISQDPGKYGTPVIIALSADAVDQTRSAVLNAGAEKFVSKPVSMQDLGEMLESIVPVNATPTTTPRTANMTRKRKYKRKSSGK